MIVKPPSSAALTRAGGLDLGARSVPQDVVLHGPGGSGKTHLAQTMINLATGGDMAAVATSAQSIAAALANRSRTPFRWKALVAPMFVVVEGWDVDPRRPDSLSVLRLLDERFGRGTTIVTTLDHPSAWRSLRLIAEDRHVLDRFLDDAVFIQVSYRDD